MGAYVIGVGMLVLLYAVVSSWRHGQPAPMKPWGAKTLEWTVPNPIPLENFHVMPVITEDAYGYGKPEPGPAVTEPAPEPVHVGANVDSGDGRPGDGVDGETGSGSTAPGPRTT
jgi:cytochrome c oxidase subunit 1